jgi:hypothetical protein
MTLAEYRKLVKGRMTQNKATLSRLKETECHKTK